MHGQTCVSALIRDLNKKIPDNLNYRLEKKLRVLPCHCQKDKISPARQLLSGR